MENSQNNDDFNYDEIMKEVESKLWSEDIMSLPNKEIQSLLQNIMWQIFLVKTNSIDVNIKAVYGSIPHVSIIINGYSYRDGLNMDDDEFDEGYDNFEEDEEDFGAD